MPKPLKTATLAVTLAVLSAAIACGAADTADRPPTPDLAATIQAIVTAGAQPAGAPAEPTSPATPQTPGAPASPDQPTPQPTDNPALRDLTPDQREELDRQIANLSEIVQILAECAAEAGETVPAPGSSAEAGWYARAAITHSACAATKGTGIDFTGGN